LHGSEGDQRALRPCEPTEQRAEREERKPDEKESPAPEEVGEPPAEQEGAAEHDRVGGDHPLQVLLGEAEIALDRGQGDVNDRDVENDHELRSDDQRERHPAPPLGRGSDCRLSHLILLTLWGLAC
jgi:hypothetical protein